MASEEDVARVRALLNLLEETPPKTRAEAIKREGRRHEAFCKEIQEVFAVAEWVLGIRPDPAGKDEETAA